MMNFVFANTAAYAQDACAASACPEMNTVIVLILDAALLLASIIIILSIILLVLPSHSFIHRKVTHSFSCLPLQQG